MDDKNTFDNEAFDNLPISFEENIGQKDRQIKFIARGGSFAAFFTPTGPVIVHMSKNLDASILDKDKKSLEQQEYEYSEIKMKVEGADPNTKIVGEDKFKGKPNYLTLDDPEKYVIDVPNYEKIRYQDIYPGIDLVYFIKSRQLAYNFIIKPGADPKVITLRFRGSDKVELDDGGNLLIRMRTGNMTLQKPKAYQNINGKENEVESSYMVHGEKNVAISVGEYNKGFELIIE